MLHLRQRRLFQALTSTLGKINAINTKYLRLFAPIMSYLLYSLLAQSKTWCKCSAGTPAIEQSWRHNIDAYSRRSL